jgi:hypothetical protein
VVVQATYMRRSARRWKNNSSSRAVSVEQGIKLGNRVIATEDFEDRPSGKDDGPVEIGLFERGRDLDGDQFATARPIPNKSIVDAQEGRDLAMRQPQPQKRCAKAFRCHARVHQRLRRGRRGFGSSPPAIMSLNAFRNLAMLPKLTPPMRVNGTRPVAAKRLRNVRSDVLA